MTCNSRHSMGLRHPVHHTKPLIPFWLGTHIIMYQFHLRLPKSFSDVELVHNDLHLARKFKGFYYTLGGPQPKRVRLTHSWAESIVTVHGRLSSKQKSITLGYLYLCLSFASRSNFTNACFLSLYMVVEQRLLTLENFYLCLAFASRSYFSMVRSSTCPVRYMMCPLMVDLPAHTHTHTHTHV